MKKISFYKMVATGNDFVVVDNRKKAVTDAPRFAREVCDRHQGVGADGLLLLEPSKGADYKMRIVNADGSEAEACGNGFRCAALLAYEKLGFPAQQTFESLAGKIDAFVKRSRVRVRLMNPSDFKEEEKIQAAGRDLHYYFIRVGVPHVVIFVEGVSEMPVFEIGREVRYHPHFKPAGTNVNFVEIKGPRSIAVRTYERGVEVNTLACGTGSTASAVVSVLMGRVETPVEVRTEGGEILTVDFARNGEKVENVYLEGGAKIVFEGELAVNDKCQNPNFK